MATPRQWSLAYAKQARADLNARAVLLREAALPACQQLHFLQMACEKLCKSHLCLSGSRPDDLQTSHAYIATVLPVIFRVRFAQTYQRRLRHDAQLLKLVEHLAREIELLAPAVRRGGKRPDNCEYPWEDAAGNVLVPAERQFPTLDLLTPQGILFLKLVETAIDELRQPQPRRPASPKP